MHEVPPTQYEPPRTGPVSLESHVPGRRDSLTVLAGQALIVLASLGGFALTHDTVGVLATAVVVRLGLACGLWALPRAFRYFAPLALAGTAVAYGSGGLTARLLGSSPWFQLALVDCVTAICLSGCLWLAARPLARTASLCVGALATLLLISLAITDNEARTLHHARLARMRAHLGPIVAEGNHSPNLRGSAVPSGAVDFDAAWWRLADSDVDGKAKILSNEITLRLAPCLAVSGPLAKWRAQERRTGQELANLVEAGLEKCDGVGIDIDAIEHLILMPFLLRPSPATVAR